MLRQLRLTLILITVFASGWAVGAEEPTASVTLKEPKYETEKPLYCQLLLEGKRDVPIWMVMDGDHFYFDRNADGDLTEPGERLTQKPDPGHTVTFTNQDLQRRFREVKLRWRNGDGLALLDVSLSVEGKFVLGSIQDEATLSTTAAKAPIILISDNLILSVIDRPKFRFWTGNNARTILPLAVDLGTKSPTNHYAYVEPESLPEQVYPIAEMQYTPRKPGDEPRRQFVDIDRRGTGYFYGTATIPQGIPPGPVTVTVKMKNWKHGEVKPAVEEITLPELKNLPVVSPKRNPA